MGWPAAQSRSPFIHGYWLKQLGIDGEYDAIELPPVDFPTFVSSLEANGFVGGNVTAPHKEAAFLLMEGCDAAAKRLQAVNTIWLRDGRLQGANTDGAGFLANLDEGAPGWDATTRHAVVLGAGGAARAVIGALLDRGVGRVDIVNRTHARAAETTALFDPRVGAHSWDALPRLLPQADLLCNATSLGMAGKDELEIDLMPLKAGALVTDLVYVPLVTRLLAAARQRGHPVVDGLGMLLHQAVPGFERWFGIRPLVTPELRALVIQNLAGKG